MNNEQAEAGAFRNSPAQSQSPSNRADTPSATMYCSYSSIPRLILVILTTAAMTVTGTGIANAWVWVPNFKGSPGGDWGTGQYVPEPGDEGSSVPTITPGYTWSCSGAWSNGEFIVGLNNGTHSITGGYPGSTFPNDNNGNVYRDQAKANGKITWCSFDYSTAITQRDGKCFAYDQFAGYVGGPRQGDTPEFCVDRALRCKVVQADGFETSDGVRYREPNGIITAEFIGQTVTGKCFYDDPPVVEPEPEPTIDGTPEPTPTPTTPTPGPTVINPTPLPNASRNIAVVRVSTSTSGKKKVKSQVSYSEYISGNQTFKLQKKSGSKWKNVRNSSVPVNGTTASVKFSTKKGSTYRVCVLPVKNTNYGKCSSAVRSR